jgi:hypothetical protein
MDTVMDFKQFILQGNSQLSRNNLPIVRNMKT